MTDVKAFLTSDEAAEYLTLKRTTLEAWRWRGVGPVFLKFGGVVRYRQKDIDDYIESRVREVTVPKQHSQSK